ncbi:MAG: YceI family protein [Moraxellaceae bacterium]
MKLIRDLFIASTLASVSLAAMADKVVTYTVDPTHTQVYFSWNHVGFSNPGAIFRDISGTITGNHDQPEKSSVEVTMPVKSVDSFVPLLNDHLINSGDYFKTAEHPVVTFKSTGIRDIQRQKRTFTLLGNLTVNGITKPVKLQARANTIGPHPFYDNAAAAGFEATATIRRSDFNMGKYTPVVSDDLEIRITVEAIETQAYQKALEKQAAAQKAATK